MGVPTFKSFKKESRRDWGNDLARELNREEIWTGAILRIADAVEAMASNHVQLQDERDRLKKLLDRERELATGLRRRNAALRGHATRQKNKLKAAPPQAAES